MAFILKHFKKRRFLLPTPNTCIILSLILKNTILPFYVKLAERKPMKDSTICFRDSVTNREEWRLCSHCYRHSWKSFGIDFPFRSILDQKQVSFSSIFMKVESCRLSFPLVFLNPVSFSTISFASCQLEWMHGGITEAFEKDRDNPFDCRSFPSFFLFYHCRMMIWVFAKIVKPSFLNGLVPNDRAFADRSIQDGVE